MTVTELLESVQFVVDTEGNKKAVLLDFAIWQEVLQLLMEMEEEDDVQAVKEIEARLAAREERVYSHEEVWAEIEELEARGALPD
jgi:hypothetical protein